MVSSTRFSTKKTQRRLRVRYKYYIEVQSDEHYLYASELAEIIGAYTSSGKPHTKFVSYVYHSSHKRNKVFYHTRKGLREVFPLSDNDIERFANLLKNSARDKSGAYIVSVPSNDLSEVKTFYVYTKEEEYYFHGTSDF